jgi:hypothetical protein
MILGLWVIIFCLLAPPAFYYIRKFIRDPQFMCKRKDAIIRFESDGVTPSRNNSLAAEIIVDNEKAIPLHVVEKLQENLAETSNKKNSSSSLNLSTKIAPLTTSIKIQSFT